MGDDINKRKKMEELMNIFIKQSKLKMNEEDKIITFNRLIEDTNRRLEEKEKILQSKEEEENVNINLLKMALNKDNKKYSAKKWNKIYKQRFETFSKNKYKKFIKNISNEIQDELDFNELDKPKKIQKKKNEVKQIIENNIKNLYNDFIIRKQKMINKENNIKLMNKKNKLLYSDELNKNNRVKKIIKSKSINKTKNINNKDNINNLKINKDVSKDNSSNINKKIYCFTPKSSKSKHIYKIPDKTYKTKDNNNNLGGNIMSEILINTFFMNHVK